MSKFYEKYWSEAGGYLNDFNLKWPKLKKFIPQEKGIVIVDFGCGNGQIIKVGLDVSKNALKQAREILPNCKFYKIEDGESLPLENNSADEVFIDR